MNRTSIFAAVAAVALAGPLAAQGRSQQIPPGHMPPAGMCRIWITGVPPGRQPAPTDCATAERRRPANARVIYASSSTGDVWRRGLVVTRERDGLGRLIFRDANGRIVTRERTSDGYLVWRDANGNILRRELIGARVSDDNMSKAEKERLKTIRKAEKERLKAIRKANGDHRDDDDDDDDENDRGKSKGKSGKGKRGSS